MSPIATPDPSTFDRRARRKVFTSPAWVNLEFVRAANNFACYRGSARYILLRNSRSMGERSTGAGAAVVGPAGKERPPLRRIASTNRHDASACTKRAPRKKREIKY